MVFFFLLVSALPLPPPFYKNLRTLKYTDHCHIKTSEDRIWAWNLDPELYCTPTGLGGILFSYHTSVGVYTETDRGDLSGCSRLGAMIEVPS